MGTTIPVKVAGLAGINDVLDQTIVLGPEVPHYQNALFTETNLGYDARLNDSMGTTRIAGRLDKTRRLGRVPDIELHTCNPPLPCPNNHGYPCEGIPVRVEHLPNRRATAVPVQVVQNVSNPDPGYPAGYPKRDGIPVLVEYLPNHGKQGDQGYPCTGDSPVLRGVPVQVELVQVGQSDDQVVAPRRVSTPQQPLTRIASNPALLAYPQRNQGVGPYQGYPQKGKIQVPVKVERARQVWVAY